MSRIEWNKAGERFFEAGVDRGVFYPRFGPGVPWNGLTAVNELVSGGEREAIYFDGVKTLDILTAEDFSASLEAFAAPREFMVADGMRQLSPGLMVTQQPRQTFGLCYRTLIGNDLEGEELGYKLHLVYNCTASPSARNNETISGTPSPQKRQWEINSVPPPASSFKPTAHIVLDSTQVEPYLMEQFEGMLYGHDGVDPYLPTVTDLVAAFDTVITEFITELV